ncbi:hypothetical protein P7228_07975 [Altererythrobacter arenosus]|uniref:Adhesin n=1 Tax=Altererythrobacter arenosus TaxID=3032592 RepID=A0ABY8FPW7_9SPHN|nr:hypothetical protein [Altererythrobacter sp. CAU 1644]WFL75948.1 hypothetical protein P7228_07975 [Altererythrobacter sp. CAU 1644]
MIAAPSIGPLPVLFLLFGAVPLAAQDDQGAQDEVLVAEGSTSGNSGRIAVNVAAGSQNQQAGSAVIAIGDIPIGANAVSQHIATPDMTDRRTAVAVGPGALSNNSGLLSVNLSAGNQNQSANLATLTIGTSGVVSDQMLAQTSAPTNPAGQSGPGLEAPNDAIAIDDSALAGNSGLVQINLVGGERNSSANTFALNVSAGGNP